MAAAASPSPAQIQQTNTQMRHALLATAPRNTKDLGATNSQGGSTSRIKIFNVGVVTRLLLLVTANVTIAVATAILSARGPYNIISRIRLTDYDGTDRVNCSGFQLFIANCIRNSTFYGANNESAAAVFTNPQAPVAIGAQTIRFFIEVPLAFDPDNPIMELQDLRGAIMCQTAVGEMYLNIDWNPSLVSNFATGDIDSVYSGNTTTTVAGNPAAGYITAQVWQEYLLPQSIPGLNGVPYPAVDLQTVYELAGAIRSNDNIANGADRLLSYPNVRSVIGAYYNVVNNGQATVGNISNMKMIANGNNILIDRSELAQLFTQRKQLNSDTVPGVYYQMHRNKPVETSLYGNVQTSVRWNVAPAGNFYIESMYEGFYTKGSALPGVQQAQ